MPELSLWLAIFIASLFVLVKASDFFTDSAEKLGVFLGLPHFIIGVTIVAIGTSLPELASSIAAVFEGASEIVVANVVGSNIANIFLILATAAIISRKIELDYELSYVDLPLLVGSTFLFVLMVWDRNYSVIEALLSIAALSVYLRYTVSTHEHHLFSSMIEKTRNKFQSKEFKTSTFFTLIMSGIFIWIGATYTVDSVIVLSQLLGVAREYISIVAVALGTSLPELAVTISATRSGKAEIAVGNILGSNIFNTLAVMGIPALFGNLIIPPSILAFGIPVMVVATVLYVIMTQDKYISRFEGYLLVIFYVFFLVEIINLAK